MPRAAPPSARGFSISTGASSPKPDDAAELARARDCAARVKAANLSKYNDFSVNAPLPAPGYVLVLDQTRGDASIKYGSATADHFREMLAFAQEDFPGARIVIKTHPETTAGHRGGHFGVGDITDRISLYEQNAPVYDPGRRRWCALSMRRKRRWSRWRASRC